MFKPKPKSLRQMLIAAVVRSVAMVVCFGAAFFAVSQMPANMTMPDSPAVEVERPQAVKSPGWFVEKFDCWTGEAPADMQGKFPGHVIITEKNVTRRAGEKKVSEALDSIFEGKPTGIQEIHAFCR